MKHLLLFLSIIFSTLFLYSCATEDEKANERTIITEAKQTKTASQFHIDVNEIIEMSKHFSHKGKWILKEVDFLKIEDDPNANVKESVYQGLLSFRLVHELDKTKAKVGYFKFKKGDVEGQYLLASRFGDSCSGVNCSKCKLLKPWGSDSSCKCNEVGHPDGRPSYCNHSTGIIGIKTSNQNDSDKNISISNPEEIVVKVNALLK